mmetsp:Transcript_6340/g.25550  ORF Transcript_6340/g.25550 Transcript_6340/m.25550 type:complete len:237 (+) Transcript_6340:399-1109(+)
MPYTYRQALAPPARHFSFTQGNSTKPPPSSPAGGDTGVTVALAPAPPFSGTLMRVRVAMGMGRCIPSPGAARQRSRASASTICASSQSAAYTCMCVASSCAPAKWNANPGGISWTRVLPSARSTRCKRVPASLPRHRKGVGASPLPSSILVMSKRMGNSQSSAWRSVALKSCIHEGDRGSASDRLATRSRRAGLAPGRILYSEVPSPTSVTKFRSAPSRSTHGCAVVRLPGMASPA